MSLLFYFIMGRFVGRHFFVIINSINPLKDVDGFHDTNKGKLFSGKSDCYIPCTPLGCYKMLESILDLEGKKVIILGRSNIVGKPLSFLLTNKNATVTLAHSKSKNLKDTLEYILKRDR